jgi:hypothetical protein
MEPPLRDAGDAAEYVGKLGQRIDIVELRRHDQRGHGSGTIGTAFGAGEQPGFAAECYCPFILPMSGRSWKSTTGIIHISAARSWCVAWSSERRANFFACKGRQASWYRSPVGWYRSGEGRLARCDGG